ncbi:hypothetical protein [Amycolatopsis sulphurea]|uniref:hypothetical protein n=1 Tax=Amycolatopsis sulphurea TaxID=76022 RepID=UPI001145E7ED|nr:hypothetical protein [Amycolatopsis sulphurea]
MKGPFTDPKPVRRTPRGGRTHLSIARRRVPDRNSAGVALKVGCTFIPDSGIGTMTDILANRSPASFNRAQPGRTPSASNPTFYVTRSSETW